MNDNNSRFKLLDILNLQKYYPISDCTYLTSYNPSYISFSLSITNNTIEPNSSILLLKISNYLYIVNNQNIIMEVTSKDLNSATQQKNIFLSYLLVVNEDNSIVINYLSNNTLEAIMLDKSNLVINKNQYAFNIEYNLVFNQIQLFYLDNNIYLIGISLNQVFILLYSNNTFSYIQKVKFENINLIVNIQILNNIIFAFDEKSIISTGMFIKKPKDTEVTYRSIYKSYLMQDLISVCLLNEVNGFMLIGNYLENTIKKNQIVIGLCYPFGNEYLINMIKQELISKEEVSFDLLSIFNLLSIHYSNRNYLNNNFTIDKSKFNYKDEYNSLLKSVIDKIIYIKNNIESLINLKLDKFTLNSLRLLLKLYFLKSIWISEFLKDEFDFELISVFNIILSSFINKRNIFIAINNNFDSNNNNISSLCDLCENTLINEIDLKEGGYFCTGLNKHLTFACINDLTPININSRFCTFCEVFYSNIYYNIKCSICLFNLSNIE